ncbi:hypothetical protein GCM10009753_16150 [Streptantibioticus ferralitis]
MSTVRVSKVLNGNGLALCREAGCGEWKATVAEIGEDCPGWAFRLFQPGAKQAAGQVHGRAAPLRRACADWPQRRARPSSISFTVKSKRSWSVPAVSSAA